MNKLNKFTIIIFLLMASVANAGLADRLNGVWEGTGYQSSAGVSQWTMKFTAENGTFHIEYPSLSCGGTWDYLRETSGSVVFSENIEYGDGCVDEGSVEVLLIEKNKLRFIYFLPNGEIAAFGELTCLGCDISQKTIVIIPL